MDDADLDVSVEAALVAKIRNAGESCIGANRFYVHSSLIDDFAARLAGKMSRLRVGPGLEPGVDIGPLVNASARDKVESLVDEAVGLGAQLLPGGKRLQRPGYFFEPTVLRDIPDEQIRAAPLHITKVLPRGMI